MRFNEIESVEFLRDGLPPHIKSPVIFANIGDTAIPICYLTKPKTLSLEDWQQFLDSFHFELRVMNKKEDKETEFRILDMKGGSNENK